MNAPSWVKILFVIGGVYDAALGATFLLCPRRLFDMAAVEFPNHVGYVQFPALLLVLFGLMFFRIGSDPVRFRDQMVYAMGLKVAYCSVIFGHWLTGGVPRIWIPFAFADLVFLALFILAWRTTAPGERGAGLR